MMYPQKCQLTTKLHFQKLPLFSVSFLSLLRVHGLALECLQCSACSVFKTQLSCNTSRILSLSFQFCCFLV